MPPEIACRVVRRSRRRPARGPRAPRQGRGEAEPHPPRRHTAQPVRDLRGGDEGRGLRHREVPGPDGEHAGRNLKGKLAYMSPEQVAGEPIDRRTDIFALGVVLWELTTGQRLFRMDSDLDTLARVQECNIPPPSSIIRGYPPDLEQVVMQALAKNRSLRFQTAREFSRALQSLLSRRGLFVASDEVAAYMTSIFTDRIAKREAHLRWASAVSDAAMGSVPPPAQHVAPAPAPRAPMHPPAPPPLPAAAPPRVAPRPAAGAAPPRPGAGGASGPDSMTANAPPRSIPRPAAVPYASAPVAQPTSRGAPIPQPPRPDLSPAPPAVAQGPASPADDDEDRTVQATPAQQAAAQAGFDDDDDGDATIVSAVPAGAMEAANDAFRARMGQPVIPAAGMPAMPPIQPSPAIPPPPPSPPELQTTRAQAPMMGRTLPLNAVVPLPVPRPGMLAPQFRTQLGLQPTAAAQAPAVPFADRNVPGSISDPALPADALGNSASRPSQPPQGWGSAGAPSPYGATHQAAAPFGPIPNFGPAGDSFAFPPAPFPGPNFSEQPAQPAAAPPPAARASRMKATVRSTHARRIPVWAVAFASCLIALVMAGGAILIYAVFHGPAKTTPQARSTGTGKGSGAASSQPASAPSLGLFGAARAGFLAAATPPPATADTQPSPAAQCRECGNSAARTLRHRRGRGGSGGGRHAANPDRGALPTRSTVAATAVSCAPGSRSAHTPAGPRSAADADTGSPQHDSFGSLHRDEHIRERWGLGARLPHRHLHTQLRPCRARWSGPRALPDRQVCGARRIAPDQARDHESRGHQGGEQDRRRGFHRCGP